LTLECLGCALDCVSCQKCRLHGKIQLLGMGTALKMLLLPEALIASSVTRAELVALFNTLHKFGKAIRAVPLLIAQVLRVGCWVYVCI
jgi:ERO1-like protein alpha